VGVVGVGAGAGAGAEDDDEGAIVIVVGGMREDVTGTEGEGGVIRVGSVF
jgi:hypothetical protein